MSAPRDALLRVIVKLFLPLSILFGLYLAIDSPLGAAGGLAGGLVIASSVACHHALFGADAARRATPLWLWRMVLGLGVAGLGLAAFAPITVSAPLLEWAAFAPANPHTINIGAVRLLELSILAAVAGAGGIAVRALGGAQRT